MSDASKLVALPAYLPRRLQAFRIAKGDAVSYLLRDKLTEKTFDIQQWQFFVLEVLPGCETVPKLLSVFADRFGREITEGDLLAFFAELADNKLLDEEASKHPLLKPFTEKAYALDKGLIKPKSFEELAAKIAAATPKTPGTPASAAPVPAGAAGPATAAGAAGADETLPPGINDADGLDKRQGNLLFKMFPMRPVASVLLPLLDPLKYGVYLLPFLTVASLMLLYQYSAMVMQDLESLRKTTTTLTHVVFSLFTINIAVRFTQALIAFKFRATLGYFGLGLRFGFLPRFMVEIGNSTQLSRRERMWVHAGPLLMRVLLFCVGTLVWYNGRDSSPWLAQAGLGLAFLCGINILLEGGNPLVKGNSYHLLSAFMDEPHLRGKSAKALLSRLRGGASTEAGNATLAAYSLASFIYAYIVVLMVTFTVTHFLMLEVRIGGASIIVGVVLAVYLTVRAVKRINFISTAYNRSVQFDRWRKRALIPSEAEAPEAAPETTGGRFWYFAKRALPLSLLILLFLPYPYEAGGSFEVYPVDRQVLTTDIAGIIEEVNYDGGEKVKKGDVIARISATDLKAQIAVLDAQIAEQKSIIADLKARPKPEEIILSQRELEVTQKRSQFSSDRVPRYTQLYQDRAISFEELEAARKERDVDLRDIATREAALALVKTGTPPDIIAAAIAKLKALTEERGLLDGKAVRTVLKAPFDGNILTLHLKQRLNSVLDKGQPFATIDSIGTFTAEIEVPESEISFVKLGAEVRARPNAFYNRTFPGKVQTVDGKVTTKSFGNVVKVVAVFDDAAGEVKTGMTGYAKVGSGSIPVWKAFSLALVRFFSVQVWSWIP